MAKRVRQHWRPTSAGWRKPRANCVTGYTQCASGGSGQPRLCRTTAWFRAGRKLSAWPAPHEPETKQKCSTAHPSEADNSLAAGTVNGRTSYEIGGQGRTGKNECGASTPYDRSSFTDDERRKYSSTMSGSGSIQDLSVTIARPLPDARLLARPLAVTSRPRIPWAADRVRLPPESACGAARARSLHTAGL